MANVVRNRLVIKANKERLKEITDFLMGEPDENGNPRYIDFRKVMPVPAALPPTIHTDGVLGWAVLERRGTMGYSVEELQKEFDALTPEEQNEWMKLGQLYRDNYQKYGYATALDWCENYWGTTENAFNQEKRADNEIWFDTRYTNIGGIIDALNMKYPDATFEYTFDGETHQPNKER